MPEHGDRHPGRITDRLPAGTMAKYSLLDGRVKMGGSWLPGKAGHYLSNASDYSVDLAIRALHGLIGTLPYESRVAAGGQVMRRIFAPAAGLRMRIFDNLDYVWPDLDQERKVQICEGCLDNFGRLFVEQFDIPELCRRVRNTPLTGPGRESLDEAVRSGRPAIIMSGHFGNYMATRAALVANGYNLGIVYKRNSNAYFERRYLDTLRKISGPVFAKGRSGTRKLLKHIRNGGMAAILLDQYDSQGLDVTFLGKTARTAASAATLGVRYDALLLPVYGRRLENGLDFEIRLEEPIRESDAVAATQAFNDNLGKMVQEHPEQWHWSHRRWRQTVARPRSPG